MPKGSHKGAAFERKICRTLSQWWTRGPDSKGRSDVFWRTSQSGGRATERLKKGEDTYGQHGDIAALDPVGSPLVKFLLFELKHGYSKTPFLDLSKCQIAPFFERWIAKAIKQSAEAKTFGWTIIYKADNRAELMCLPWDLVSQDRNFKCAITTNARNLRVYHSQHGDLILLPFEDFLTWVSPQGICDMVERWSSRE